ncbi:PRD domain-containing protein [Bacillus aerolatus]|uniref:PRD domain-containing protein n=1 Tax=Bacillus aerolatus TaxID=2653354 RepID=A0A6I1FF00_9BACI|nr:BglG family transcription antiterminator [Bacillus aerolatus]KAB7706515.1 PRD domain-containing protein [Bacillus aerolatus]
MTLDQRSIAILNKVIHSEAYVTPAVLMEELNVSKRTIYYDVDKINDWLTVNGLPPMQYVRSAGFYVSKEAQSQIKEELQKLNKERHYEFSPRERIAWMAILILTRGQKIILQDLLNKLNVSRSTLLADIRQLKNELHPFQVTLQFQRREGYFISGSEQNKRQVLTHFLSEVLAFKDWQDIMPDVQLGTFEDKNAARGLFNQTEMDRIHGILADSEQIVGVRYTDEVIQTLSLHLLLLINRLTRGKHVQMDTVEKDVIKESAEYEAACLIGRAIEDAYSVSMPEDEIFYVATYLLGAKISSYEPLESENLDTVYLKSIITRMVDDFQTYACLVFDKRAELEQNLFIHLKPAYFRIKYGIEPANPLTESIKSKYHDLFVLTKKVVHHFEYMLGKTISDEEVAYITMHFGGWLDKEGVKVQRRKKAVVVCASGIGTSRILQKQIEDLLPSTDVTAAFSVREYEKADLAGIDFVISTTPVADKGRPLYIVNPILSHAEKTTLLKHIESTSAGEKTENLYALLSIIKKHADVQSEQALMEELKTYFQAKQESESEVRRKPMLNELITEDKIQLADQAASWEEAIRTASAPLLADQSITELYVEAMINNVNTLGPYVVIAPKIALPHARPEEGVNKIGMSFLQLKESCAFSEKEEHQVNLLFVLAAVDNESHIKALSQLSTMLSNEENIHRLMKAESVSQVLDVINQYSK